MNEVVRFLPLASGQPPDQGSWFRCQHCQLVFTPNGQPGFLPVRQEEQAAREHEADCVHRPGAPAYAQWARAFTIFAGYPGDQDVSADAYQVYAGPDPSLVSAEHLAELGKLGWSPAEKYECFGKFI